MAPTPAADSAFVTPSPFARVHILMRRNSAGMRPQTVFEQHRCEWIRWVRPRALAGCLVVFGIWALLAVFASRERGFLFGVGAGAAGAMYLSIVEFAIPMRIENWRVGAEGERRTARRLLRLQLRGWIVHHSIDAGGSDRDHIVFGPTGLFLIDTKQRHGRCAVAAGTLQTSYRFSVEGRPSSEELSRRSKARAAELGALVERLAGYRPWVQPVIVIWADFPQREVLSDGVAFVHGDQLRKWLERHDPRDRASDQIHQVRTALAAIAQDGVAPVVTDGLGPSDFTQVGRA